MKYDCNRHKRILLLAKFKCETDFTQNEGMVSHSLQSRSNNDVTQNSNSDDKEQSVMNRRKVLLTTAGVSAAFLAGCSSQSDGNTVTKSDGGSKTLTVADWSGQYHTYFKKSIKPMYEKETGVTVKLVPGWSGIISKIKSAPKDDPPYDIAVTEGQMYNQARAEDLFLPLRKENIPNLNQVYPYLTNFRSTEYAIPFDGAPVSVMYNNKEIDYDIKTWQTLINEDTHITLDGGFYAYTLHIAAIVANGMDNVEEIYHEKYHDLPFKMAKKFNAASYYRSGAERWQQMQLRIANAAQSYFGVGMGRKNNNDWISVNLPDTTTGYYDHYGVVRGTDKRDMAEHFLNFMLRKDVQNKWGTVSHQLLANKNAQHSKAARAAGFPSSNEEYKDIHFPNYGYLSDYSNEFSTRFQKLKRS